MPNRVELDAISTAILYLTSQGYAVEDVSRSRAHKGYDLLAKKGSETLKIEVKGCTRIWGIPDPYVTEFDSERRLVADFLCVVYFVGFEPKLCMIPRDSIPPELVTPKSGYRISSKFKKERVLMRFVKELEPRRDAVTGA